MTFLDECIEFTGPAWDELLHHPWIEAAVSGELSHDRFRYWYASDLSFLSEHIMSRGIAKAPSDHPLREIVVDIMTADRDELQLMVGLVGEYGSFITSPWAPRPTREAYTNFLLRILYEGTFTQLCCAHYPCFAFGEILGDRFHEDTSPPSIPTDQVEWLATLRDTLKPLQNALGDEVNAQAPVSSPRDQEALRWTFLRATQHQIRTFDAAWELSDPWPGEGEAAGVITSPPDKWQSRDPARSV